MHSGFRPCVCNPASPNEKGTDEESVGYVRRAIFGERSAFTSLEEATEWLRMRLVEINTHPVLSSFECAGSRPRSRARSNAPHADA